MSKKLELTDAPQPKRTRKKAKQPLGVGDVVDKITTATGIKKVVEVFSIITGVDCGCEARKEKLNQLFRRQKLTPRCITKDEYYQLTTLIDGIKTQLKPDVQRKIAMMYSTIFGIRYEIWCDSCPGIWKARIADLQAVVKVYENDLKATE